MISNRKVTEIYFIIDKFSKNLTNLLSDYSLQETNTMKRNRKFNMS